MVAPSNRAVSLADVTGTSRRTCALVMKGMEEYVVISLGRLDGAFIQPKKTSTVA